MTFFADSHEKNIIVGWLNIFHSARFIKQVFSLEKYLSILPRKDESEVHFSVYHFGHFYANESSISANTSTTQTNRL